MRRTVCAFVAALLAAVLLVGSAALAGDSNYRNPGGGIGVNGIRDAK
jgi:hypothetical protein